MAQLIITTDLKGIRPVFEQNYGENIKRYNQIKKIFEKDRLYRLFAEPVISGTDKIAWHTEFEGTIVPFPKLDEEEKDAVKSRLKEQVNSLYISVLKNTDNKDKQLELFKFIDSCLEIPDFYDIFVIQQADGKRNFCLTRWGFMSESTTTPRKILSSLVEIKVNTIVVKVKKGNNKPAIGEEIFVKLKNEEKKFVTNDKGEIILEDFPLLEEISIYAKDKDGNRLYEKKYVISYVKEIDYYLGEENLEKQKVVIWAKTFDGRPAAKNKIRIQYEDFSQIYETDKDGKIILGNLFINTQIAVEQISDDKVVKYSKFTVEKGKELYEFETAKTEKSHLFRLKVLDEKGNILPKIPLQIVIDNQVYEYYTTDEGLIEVPNIELSQEIIVRQIEDGVPKYQQKFVFDSTKTIYIFRGKAPVPKEFFSDYTIKITDAKDNPIKNLRVLIETDSTFFSKITNEHGIVNFPNVPCKDNPVLKVEYRGNKYTEKLKCDGNKQEVKIIFKENLLWLWILLAVIVAGLLGFFISKTVGNSKPHIPAVDTLKKDTAVQIQPEEGFELYVFKDTLRTPAQDVFVSVKTKDTVFTVKTDTGGRIFLPQLKDYKGNITLKIKAKGFPEFIQTFPFVKKKEIFLSKVSSDISEIILPCDTVIRSGGYHSTIKSFNLKKSQGYMTLLYDMFQIPDKIIVYKGSIRDTSAQNIIWQSKGFESGFHKRIFKFEAPDSIVTVRIIGGDTTTTRWYFQVFCP